MSMTATTTAPATTKFEYNPSGYIAEAVKHQRNPHIQVGETIPNIPLSRVIPSKDPSNPNATTAQNFSTADDMSGNLEVLFLVPGTFTKVCTEEHAPSFTKNIAALKALGVSKIFCLATNKRDDVLAWQKQVDPKFEISMIPDLHAKFVWECGLAMDRDSDGRGLGMSTYRGAMVLSNRKVMHIEVELPAQCKKTHGDSIVAAVQRLQKQAHSANAANTAAAEPMK